MSDRRLIPTIGFVLVLAGCGGSVEFGGDAGGPDSTADTSVDTAIDTAVDTGSDVPFDIGPDAGPGPCGDAYEVPCPSHMYCEWNEGQCLWDVHEGWCQEVPVGGCPEYWAPECGCDGVTYGNPCERRSNRAQLAHAGECGTVVSCAPWLEDCPDGQMCDAPEDSCWVDGVMGTCRDIRDDCGLLWDPQCGCNATTYANECERMTAGVWLDHWGECGSSCGTPGDPPCVGDVFCEFPTGMCDSPGMWGECMAVPSGCGDDWNPVCGCDGMTYGNDCERQSARQSLLHRGAC